MINIVVALYFTNLLRQTPLKIDTYLSSQATKRAQYFCTHKLTHSGYEVYFMGDLHEYEGENLAIGYTDSVSSLYGAWYASTSHFQNIIDKNYQYTGIGRACNVTVQLFAGGKKIVLPYYQ